MPNDDTLCCRSKSWGYFNLTENKCGTKVKQYSKSTHEETRVSESGINYAEREMKIKDWTGALQTSTVTIHCKILTACVLAVSHFDSCSCTSHDD